MILSIGGEIISSEKVLGMINVNRPAFARMIKETLFFTEDKVVVARTSGGFGGFLFGGVGAAAEFVLSEKKRKKKEKEYFELSLNDLLKADKNNHAIPNSAITGITLRKRGLGKELIIIEAKKPDLSLRDWADRMWEEHKWLIVGLIPKKDSLKLEDYENILLPIFGDKLSVKK